ncbi:MAG: HipA domain-containing protein [Proteobacteria bacterium]|nr:HipA domain-containing protein [Pseudomonadota bacterium]
MNIPQEHKLSVRLFGKHLGILEQTQKGKLHFSYHDEASNPLSLFMPLKEKSFDHNHCYPYFAGLAPQGEKSLPLLSRILGVNQNDTFSLLKMMGKDCQGAVTFHQLDEPEEERHTTPLKGEMISDKALEKQIQTLPEAPLFFNNEKIHVSLSGTQYKAAVCLIDNKVAIPEMDCFSTHILKPALAPFEEKMMNEYFCMRLGNKMGINMVEVTLHKGLKTDYLLITRFDREIQQNKIKHFHQEDFCQALGYLPSAKYQKDRGPGFKSCFNLLQKTNIPAVDRNRMMQLIIYNFLIGNKDAHAKKFAIKYLNHKQFELAPFYDVCASLEANVKEMAMKLGGIYTHDEIKVSHWHDFCSKRGFSYLAFKEMFSKQCEIIIDTAKQERANIKEAGFDCAIVDMIISVIQKNCKLVGEMF